MTPLSIDEIYNDLDINWWIDQGISPPGSPANQLQLPSTMLYYKDKANNWNAFQSVGVKDYENTDITDYVQNYLMWEAARQLNVGHCTGSITNVKPQDYQVFPIYYK